MKLRLCPQKGWKWRVIVCREDGKHLCDDVMHEGAIPQLTKDLIKAMKVDDSRGVK